MYYVSQAEPLFSRLCKRIVRLVSGRLMIRSRPIQAQRHVSSKLCTIRLQSGAAERPWLPLLAASIVTFGIFQLVLPTLAPSWLTALLLHRGPVQPVTVGVALLSLFAVVQRAFLGTQERCAVRRAAGWDWPQAPMSLSVARTGSREQQDPDRIGPAGV
jgi:hypothetical protein